MCDREFANCNAVSSTGGQFGHVCAGCQRRIPRAPSKLARKINRRRVRLLLVCGSRLRCCSVFKGNLRRGSGHPESNQDARQTHRDNPRTFRRDWIHSNQKALSWIQPRATGRCKDNLARNQASPLSSAGRISVCLRRNRRTCSPMAVMIRIPDTMAMASQRVCIDPRCAAEQTLQAPP